MAERNGWLDLPGVLRGLRRRADVSQRELAASSGVPAATVGRLESGAANDPRLRTVERLVRAAGARLAIVDLDGTEPAAPVTDGWRDGADRRFPAHLDPVPQTVWRKGWRDVIGFARNRWVRDWVRRRRTGEGRSHLFTEIRQLGPGDTAVLDRLRADATALDPGGRSAPEAPPLTGPAALRYLRDPSLMHWIAEDRGRVFGYLVAYVLRCHAGPPEVVVTGVGVRPEHRDGAVGRLLVAALSDEAARPGAGEVVALARDPAAATYLRGLGFARVPGRSLLRLPG